jgi:hypothetical protein
MRFEQGRQRTIKDLREQARKCKTTTGAAIMCGIVMWLEGWEAVEGGLEPHEFVDLWARGDGEQATELIQEVTC